MPPRLRCTASCGLGSALNHSRLSSKSAALLLPSTSAATSASRQYATAAPGSRLSALKLPDDYVPPVRPPTARPADARKSQLLRNYTSLLRVGTVREERGTAKVSGRGTDSADIASRAQLQVIRGRIFDVALKIVEFHDPSKVAPTTVSSATGEKVQMVFNHDLSQTAYDTAKSITKGEMAVPESSVYAQISPLLVGPLALLTLPAVSPAHLSAALSVLSPNPPAFPAPSRKRNPGYYEPTAQSGLQKLMLVGGRIEDKVFDIGGVQWVGGIEGGVDSLRAQLVVMLQCAGLGLTAALEGASKSLWLTMESRRTVLEEEQNGGKKEESS
ncbi:hypothetical protein MMYC01_202689 [Madurella mycetomatis]|uniref:54S ribosomal protein L11, mitochondrial n=1 Tax=Madurella mycetomatis TaxID=100816 RepID=A0A175WAS8_9PEZI|nr:hypothetical protein MMYC01_202689 [Madurella mycetomatis]